MRLFYILILVVVMGCAAWAYQQASTSKTCPLCAVVSASKPDPTPQAAVSATQEINNNYSKQIMDRIAGREKEPAGRVFKNMQIPWLKSTRAGDVISIMDGGYSRALGVTCTHCHNEKDFALDDKRPKLAAREMAIMHWTINQQLGKMKNVLGKPNERFINCATCHRGSVDTRGGN